MPTSTRPKRPVLLAVDQEFGRMLLSAIVFDPNRWPKANDMLGSPKRMAVVWAILIAVAIALLIVLPALEDWLRPHELARLLSAPPLRSTL
jgi:hypothetical protein